MAQHPHHTDLSGFGFVEAPELTWRDVAPWIAGFSGLIYAVFNAFGPAFLALTRMMP